MRRTGLWKTIFTYQKVLSPLEQVCYTIHTFRDAERILRPNLDSGGYSFHLIFRLTVHSNEWYGLRK